MEINNEKFYTLMEIAGNGIIPITYTSLYKLVCENQIKATNFAVSKKRRLWKIQGKELKRFIEERSK